MLGVIFSIVGFLVGFISGIAMSKIDRFIKREDNDFQTGVLKILIQRSDGSRRWVTINVEAETDTALAGEEVPE